MWMPYVTGQYVRRSVGVPGWSVVHGDKAVCSSARAWVRLVQCVIKNFKAVDWDALWVVLLHNTLPDYRLSSGRAMKTSPPPPPPPPAWCGGGGVGGGGG